jgi:hypothetical protein
VDLPWRIYDRSIHTQWVPPLRLAVRDALDTKRNPFYRRAERALFLARRGGTLVGRIAAIENRAHNEFHDDRVGFFGFFECRDDPEAAGALVGAAGDWLRSRGLEVMRGPVNPSTNHECGLLVDGFEHHPMIMTTWNPPYYGSLLERSGLAKAKDLLAFPLPVGDPAFVMPPRFVEHAERARAESRLAFRDMSVRNFARDIEACWDIYNAAWERNWGFTPMAREEFLHMGRDLKHLLFPQWAFIAEVDGRPAGFLLTIPDYNEVFKRIGTGRLLPFGWIRILRARRRLRTGRIIALGIKAEHRVRGIMALFFHELLRRGRKDGALLGEASWILEDNRAMILPLAALGVAPHRRWRLYESPLSGEARPG